MRVFLVVIDSFGVGELPDAALYGDEGSNTYKNIYNQTKVFLKNMSRLGLNNIDGINIPCEAKVVGSYGKCAEKSNAKDSVAGHYELAGIVLEKPYPVFPNGFPKDFVQKLQSECGVEFIGNEVASGTEIVSRLGEKHIKTGCPILYTSQDSVLQIAADEQTFGLQRLYDLCQKVRELCDGDYRVARVIARPFIKENGNFVRTANRHDYAISPPEKSMLDKLSDNKIMTISVGKVYDIFCGQGIQKGIPAKTNEQTTQALLQLAGQDFHGLVFANYVETDMLYGHRNNTQGYADALLAIDETLGKIMQSLGEDDYLVVTADHGCDPTTVSTDHSREYVPLLVYGKKIKAKNMGTFDGFDIVSKSILDLFDVQKCGRSIFDC